MIALYELVPARGAARRPRIDPLKYEPSDAPSSPRASFETLTVKLRYKKPAQEKSRLIEILVTDRGPGLAAASEDFRFAAAVGGVGMVLRDSPDRGDATLSSMLYLACRNQADDPGRYRSEFVRLVHKARELRGM